MKWTFKPTHLIGPILAVLAGWVYGRTLSSGAYPDDSALLIAQFSGLLGLDSVAHPLWAWALKPFRWLVRGDLARAYNVASLVFGAVGVGLCYHLVQSAVRRWLAEEGVQSARVAGVAAVLAGVGAAGFLAFCIPYWVISNRAYAESFGLLLLMGLAALLQVYTRSFRPIWLWLWAFLYAVCLVETAVLFVFAPLFGLYLLVAMWRAQRLEVRTLLPAALCGLIGWGVYLWVAWHYARTETARLYEVDHLWPALWEILKMQYRQVLQGLPKVGWLLVGLVTVVPWLTALLVGRRALNDERDWSFYLLHLVMTAVLMAVLFNTAISPWGLLGFSLIVVTPYLLAAACFGYLVAYWFLLPMNWGGPLEDRPVLRGMRVGVGILLAAGLLACAGVAAWRNRGEADARPAAIINRLAGQVVDDLRGRSWLITSGEIDNNILIAAHDRKVKVQLLDRTRGNDGVYRRHLANRLEDPNLKSLAEVSLVAFLQEWLKAGSHRDREVAVFSLPDLWFSAGLTYLPGQALYLGKRPEEAVDIDAALDAWRRFWTAEIPRLRPAGEDRGHAPMFKAFARRHLSMLANNIGVWLEDAGRPEAAYEAYGRARELEPDNISALLNQYVLAQADTNRVGRDEVIGRVDELVRDGRRKAPVWSLARTYGYVRMPEAFAEIGLSWAMSGYPGMAVSGLRRAIELKGEQAPRMKQLLAAVYLAQDQPEQSAELYGEVLAQAPENRNALFGLARSRIVAGDYAGAGELLRRLEKLGASRERTALEWVQIDLATGEWDRARVQLQELVELNPRNLSAWTLLAALHYSRQDEAGLQECLKHLEQAERPPFAGLILQGLIAMDRQRLENARRFFEQALVLQPRNVILLGLMLQLDVRMNRPEGAEARVRQLLELDPDHAEANYILGSLQFRRQQVTLAEASFRRSLARDRKPEALNDLAWLLQSRGMLDEAEALVREALERNSLMASAWDSLGVILLKRGRLEESETALLKAISLQSEQPAFQVHLAELYVARGAMEKARPLVTRLLEQASGVEWEDRNTLLRLRREMNAGQ